MRAGETQGSRMEVGIVVAEVVLANGARNQCFSDGVFSQQGVSSASAAAFRIGVDSQIDRVEQRLVLGVSAAAKVSLEWLRVRMGGDAGRVGQGVLRFQ